MTSAGPSYDALMDEPAGVVLRQATVDDAEAGARMHIACWREAYGPITDLDRLRDHLADEAGWAARWRSQIEKGPAPTIAVVGDEVVGFAFVGPARHDEAPAATELYALYVRASSYGTGVGRALFERVVGDRTVYLWVLEDNRRARAFYAKQGLRPDGGRKKYDPLDAWEIRMVRPCPGG